MTTLAREAATTLVDELADAGLHRGLVADVGCGSGVLSGLLIEAGYDALAIDPSPAFMDLVARNVPHAERQLTTASTMSLPDGMVAVAAVGETLAYDLDVDLDELFEQFHDCLRPGGVLLFDVPAPARHGGDRSTGVTDTGASLLAMETFESGFRLTREITLFTRTSDGHHRRTDEVHHLRLYDPADVRAGLSRAGFVAIRPLERYGAHGPLFHEGWCGFLAGRP